MEQSALVKQPISATKRRLEQLINCFICNDKVRGANMCPYCCKLFCQSCIKCVLQGRLDCPHCNKPLKPSSLSHCTRFMNQLSCLLQQLIQHRNLDELCLDHNVAQDYYCKDCLLPICCECSFFGQHHYHQIQPLKNIYQPKIQQIKLQLQVLKKAMRQIQQKCQQLQPQSSGLKKQKSRLLSQIQQNQQFYNLKILHDIVNKQTQLQEIQKHVNFHITRIQNFSSHLQKLSNTSTSLSEIQNSKNQQQFKDIIQKQFDIPNQQRLQMPFLHQIFPEFFFSSFILTEFSKKVQSNQLVYSPVVNFDGNQWCLKIYPTGCQKVKGGYFTVFLELRASLSEIPIEYEYKIQLINPKDPLKSIMRSFMSVFEPGQIWGYQKYIQIGKLLRQGYISNNDSIEINYYIRPLNYSKVSKQKELFANLLDEQLQRQQQQIRMLQSQF